MVQVTQVPGRDLVGERADVLEGAHRIDDAGKRDFSSLPSTWRTLTGCPATPSSGCSTMKPVRLVSTSVSGSATASKKSEPSLRPVIVAS